jgi:hypothetical protein
MVKMRSTCTHFHDSVWSSPAPASFFYKSGDFSDLTATCRCSRQLMDRAHLVRVLSFPFAPEHSDLQG